MRLSVSVSIFSRRMRERLPEELGRERIGKRRRRMPYAKGALLEMRIIGNAEAAPPGISPLLRRRERLAAYAVAFPGEGWLEEVARLEEAGWAGGRAAAAGGAVLLESVRVGWLVDQEERVAVVSVRARSAGRERMREMEEDALARFARAAKEHLGWAMAPVDPERISTEGVSRMKALAEASREARDLEGGVGEAARGGKKPRGV